MTDYVKSTSFASKDALLTGNPLKIVKGTEIDTEFNNIQTSSVTKADLLSPTFTGTPSLPTGATATTQTFGNSATLLSTTAFVQAALQALHPVGSIYSSTSATNPNTSFGFGTWVQFGAGRVMIGVGGSFGAGATGGSNDAVVVSHTHTATVSDPGHNHTLSDTAGPNPTADNVQTGGGWAFWKYNTLTTSAATTGITVSNSTTGSSGTNANLQPYIVVYMWNRVS